MLLASASLLVACGDASVQLEPAGDGAPTAIDATPETAEPVDTLEPEDTEPPPLVYPDEPQGLTLGSIFPNATLPGYRNGAGEWVDISMLDYYDPDGSRGITALQIDVECQWCPPSN
ncbi:MAG: hypothetical protein ABI175_02200, partial [Polyangiales bacterium]